MLPEIFSEITEKIFLHLDEKNTLFTNTRILPDHAWRKKHLRVELLRLGHAVSKNLPIAAALDKSLYAFTFFIIGNIPDYSDSLRFIEIICDYFDKKPFLQLKIDEQEFEVAVSPLELSIEELNQFWMAQNQPHQPILFYQARISEI